MYSKLVREIRDALGRGSVAREEIVELASEYSDACEQVNQRLSNLVQLLAKGLRNEAVELAEQKPPVLEVIQQLDFPDRALWKDYLTKEKLPLPPALDLTAAEQIEDAYDELRKLDPLLKTNRLLALSQAPIQARLVILRKLAAKDQMNPVWQKDVENLERARVEQIKNEYSRAKKKEDTAKLDALSAESDGNWAISFPVDLKRRIERARETVARNQARNRLEIICKDLNECLVAYDGARGRALRQIWDADNAIAQLEADDPISLRAVEPLAWLAEEDRLTEELGDFDAQVAGLERAIDDKCTLSDLDRKIYEIQKFERELSPPLVQRLKNYRSNLETSKRRSYYALVAGAVVTLLVAATVIFFFISAQQARAAVSDAVTQLEALADNYTGAKTYFEALPQKLKENGSLISVWSKIEESQRESEQRNTQFKELVEKVDFKGELGGQLDTLIGQLQRLADDSFEQNIVDKYIQELDNERTNRSIARNRKFLENMAEFMKEIAVLENMPSGSVLNTKLTELKDRVDLWMLDNKGQVDGRPTVSSENSKQAGLILKRIDRRIRQIDQSNMAEKTLGDLSITANNLEQFASALGDFSNRFPEHEFSADFRVVSQEQAVWKKLSAWQQLANDPVWDDLLRANKETAASLVQRIEQLNSDPTRIGLESDVAAVEDYLKKLASSNDKGVADVALEVKNFCNQPTFRFQQVMIKDGEFYYLSESRVAADGSAKIRYYVDINDTDQTKYVSLTKSEYDYIGFAGHCNICEQLAQLDAEDFRNIHEYGQQLVHVALTTEGKLADAHVDPIVRALILDFLLDVGGEASSMLNDEFRKMRVELGTLGVESIDWFKAGDVVANEKRKILKENLFREFASKSAELDSRINKVDLAATELLKWRDITNLHCVGWIRKSAPDEWVLDSNDDHPKGMKLYCIVPIDSGATSGQIRNIGNLGDGGIVSQITDTSIKSGRPVFARKE